MSPHNNGRIIKIDPYINFKGEKFVESQLGMIPEGWKVGTLSDLLDIRYGKDHKKLNDGNIPV